MMLLDPLGGLLPILLKVVCPSPLPPPPSHPPPPTAFSQVLMQPLAERTVRCCYTCTIEPMAPLVPRPLLQFATQRVVGQIFHSLQKEAAAIRGGGSSGNGSGGGSGHGGGNGNGSGHGNGGGGGGGGGGGSAHAARMQRDKHVYAEWMLPRLDAALDLSALRSIARHGQPRSHHAHGQQ